MIAITKQQPKTPIVVRQIVSDSQLLHRAMEAIHRVNSLPVFDYDAGTLMLGRVTWQRIPQGRWYIKMTFIEVPRFMPFIGEVRFLASNIYGPFDFHELSTGRYTIQSADG